MTPPPPPQPGRPRMLDAFCRKGGSSAGYIAAGWDVTGVDIEDHADGFPGRFVQGDAVEYILAHGAEYDAIHAGPPCQGQIRITKANRRRRGWTDDHINLIPDTRAALARVGVPSVIENGPSEHLRPDLVLCGLMFGLPTLRDRYFELDNWIAPQSTHPSHRGHLTAGWRHGCLRTFEPSVCPKHDRWCKATVYGVYGKGGGKPSVEESQRALGIDWMTDQSDLNEAIPPLYTAFIGAALLAHLSAAAAA